METYAKWLAGSNGTITQGGGLDLDAAIAKVNSCCERLQPQAVEGAGTFLDDRQRLLDLWRFRAMGNDTMQEVDKVIEALVAMMQSTKPRAVAAEFMGEVRVTQARLAQF